jgi:hypothetical protein
VAGIRQSDGTRAGHATLERRCLAFRHRLIKPGERIERRLLARMIVRPGPRP